MSTMEKITFGAAETPGYRVGDPSAPAVVVVQEWWGVTEEVKRQAEHLSQQGFQCLVPDLYKGTLGVTVEEANHSMSNLDFPAAVDEICQAAAHLQERGAPAVGVTGFCMGGALSLLSAQHCNQIVCAAPFYGTPNGNPAPFWNAADIAPKPIQMHFGENDQLEGFSDPATAKLVKEQLEKGGCPVELFLYSGVGHGFMNNTPWPFDTYEEKQEALPAGGFSKTGAETHEVAWSRVADFFKKHL